MSCDCEAPSAYTNHLRTARKPHTCDECFEEILRGEAYLETTGIWEGSPSRFHRHAWCARLAHALEEFIRTNQERERQERAELECLRLMALAVTGTYDARVHVAKLRAVGRFDGACDCIPLGHLGEALRDFTREVLGYDPQTGGVLAPAPEASSCPV